MDERALKEAASLMIECQWCGAVIRRHSAKDSRGLCLKCYARMLGEQGHSHEQGRGPHWASDRLDRGAQREMIKVTQNTIPFGLFELDSAGTVTDYRAASEQDLAPDEIVGRDFFRELAPAPEFQELKSRFLRFMTFGDAVERFSISCALEQNIIKVQIVLARVTEHANGQERRLALVRLMPEGQSLP